MTHAPTLAIALPLLALAMFSRIRRNVGRQRVRPGRMRFRIGFLLLALLALGFTRPFDPALTGAMLAGAVVGIALAFFALRHTRFETIEAIRYYYPNLYIGLAVSALFIGRIVYRFIVLSPALQSAGQNDAATNSMMFYGARTPLTLGLLGLVVGYYAAYYIGVLIRSNRAAPPLAVPTEAQA
ncbi:MAG: hypothetical protein JWR16_1574 [Nevskia sp.]|nr:hypothetical protein [Nevskia sp.]